MTKKVLFFVLGIFFYGSIFAQNRDVEIPSVTNVKIFENTNAFELAKAVKNQQVSAIKKIYQTNPEYVLIEDPYFNLTVLHWAVGMEKYSSVKCLLELGVNPNLKSSETDMTPLYIAAGKSFKSILPGSSTRFVKLLLQYHANPNINIKKITLPTIVVDGGEIISPSLLYSENSPLMAASSFDKIQLLIEEGHADVNYRKSNGTSILSLALLNRDFELAYYLLLECNAKIEKKEIDAFNRISVKENSKNYSKYMIIRELFKQYGLK